MKYNKWKVAYSGNAPTYNNSEGVLVIGCDEINTIMEFPPSQKEWINVENILTASKTWIRSITLLSLTPISTKATQIKVTTK